MELVFLLTLMLLMMLALISGYPVSFALPGAAILSIALAALCGYVFAGDMNAFFAQGGPVEWLSAGVTNFRSLYWDVERDTLIAIPLFVFMGIMLQRSKIAEDLLIAMAQLFGPVPGGLGISVVFVGALLAATTGIVGATVIAMGLISLPAMLSHNYSKSLACGTICASGTLGQIIPPSIVLIILADQLSSAVDQAGTVRKTAYKVATGEFSMPTEFDITSASAGDMFMGAFLPGLVLVGLYMAYILISALLKPGIAPPVPYDGDYDRKFAARVLLALVPPLALIFIVLGSIVMGIATVNQAGAVGAIGAMIMGGYRLKAGQRGAYAPAVLAIVSVIAIMTVLKFYDINVKNIKTTEDVIGVTLASIAVVGLLYAILWSTWRSYTIEDTLTGVMIETAKTTSMVFIILIGAAMLTSAFRAFGGEELVKEFLTGLPGGFWAQFVVVMMVIFVLGFFLDFIEIAVVVVPIVAPILLSHPGANITAVWLGVMVGLNIQTSFLTPPFGFALFYLRGVAPPSVKTTQIYLGAIAFIVLQLVGLAIAGAYPSLVNYLPNRTYLTSDTAPPPMNPRLQMCMENIVFADYEQRGGELRTAIDKARAMDVSTLPKKLQTALKESFEKALDSFSLADKVKLAKAGQADYEPGYRPIHETTRRIQRKMLIIDGKLEEQEQTYRRLSNTVNVDAGGLEALKAKIQSHKESKQELEAQIPDGWESARKAFLEHTKAVKKARNLYRRNVDESYEVLMNLIDLLDNAEALNGAREQLQGLDAVIKTQAPEQARDAIKRVAASLGKIPGVSQIKSRLSKARRALKGDNPKQDKALEFIQQGLQRHADEVQWRTAAAQQLLPSLRQYDDAVRHTIGLRLQKRLTTAQAEEVASCQSVHRDISLYF